MDYIAIYKTRRQDMEPEFQARMDENCLFCGKETDPIIEKHKIEYKEEIGGGGHQNYIKVMVTTILSPAHHKCDDDAQMLKKTGWILILTSILTLLIVAIYYLPGPSLYLVLGITIGMIAILMNGKIENYSYTHRIQE